MPPLRIQIDNTVYSVAPASMAYTSGDKCYVNVVYDEAVSDKTVYLGQPFIESFSAYFDYENGQVSFGKNMKAPAAAGIKHHEPPHRKRGGWRKFGIAMIIILLIAFAVLAVYCVFRIRKRRNETSNASSIAYRNLSNVGK